MCELAGEELALEAFRNGQDLYSVVGTKMFGTPVSKKETPALRFLSKTACLACQFALSGGGFQRTARLGGQIISLESATDTVQKWRRANPNIVALWDILVEMVEWAASERPKTTRTYRHLTFGYDKRRNAVYIKLPTGLMLWYPDPHWATVKDANGKVRTGWAFYNAKTKKSAFFTKNLLANNTVQALARSITLGYHAPLLQSKYNLRYVLTVHDELVFVVPTRLADRVATLVKMVMSLPPSWCPDLPLDAEVHIAERYGDSK